MIPASLVFFSVAGIVGLFSWKWYELSRGAHFFTEIRTRLDQTVEDVEKWFSALYVRVEERFTFVRMLLALFGGIGMGIAFLVTMLEYVRVHIDRMTRYVALHYGTEEITQSVFLKEISAHKKTVRKPRAPRRKAVDNKAKVV